MISLLSRREPFNSRANEASASVTKDRYATPLDFSFSSRSKRNSVIVPHYKINKIRELMIKNRSSLKECHTFAKNSLKSYSVMESARFETNKRFLSTSCTVFFLGFEMATPMLSPDLYSNLLRARLLSADSFNV